MNKASPPANFNPGLQYPSAAREMVVFPDPDSPIRATTSPRLTLKSTPLTMGNSLPSSRMALILRPFASKIISLLSLSVAIYQSLLDSFPPLKADTSSTIRLMPTVRVAIAIAGAITGIIDVPYCNAPRFSRTIEPQSACGG